MSVWKTEKRKKWQRSARHVSCTSSIGTLGYMARGFCYPVVNGGSDKELRIEFPNHLKVPMWIILFFLPPKIIRKWPWYRSKCHQSWSLFWFLKWTFHHKYQQIEMSQCHKWWSSWYPSQVHSRLVPWWWQLLMVRVGWGEKHKYS